LKLNKPEAQLLQENMEITLKLLQINTLKKFYLSEAALLD